MVEVLECLKIHTEAKTEDKCKKKLLHEYPRLHGFRIIRTFFSHESTLVHLKLNEKTYIFLFSLHFRFRWVSCTSNFSNKTLKVLERRDADGERIRGWKLTGTGDARYEPGWILEHTFSSVRLVVRSSVHYNCSYGGGPNWGAQRRKQPQQLTIE